MPKRDVDEWFWHVGVEYQRIADELPPGRPWIASKRHWEPNVDVIEEVDRFLIKAELSGIRAEEIRLIYDPENQTLQFEGERIGDDGDTPHGPVSTHQLEILYGSFKREIKLPNVAIQADGIRAQYRNGMLSISVPKLVKKLS